MDKSDFNFLDTVMSLIFFLFTVRPCHTHDESGLVMVLKNRKDTWTLFGITSAHSQHKDFQGTIMGGP